MIFLQDCLVFDTFNKGCYLFFRLSESVCSILMIKPGYAFMARMPHNDIVFLSMHNIRRNIMLISLIDDDANLDHLVKVVSAGFLYDKVTAFPIIN